MLHNQLSRDLFYDIIQYRALFFGLSAATTVNCLTK